MSDTKWHKPRMAQLHRLMALRFYLRVAEARHAAEHYGGDLTDHGPLVSPAEADDRYEAAVREWLNESPNSVREAQAMVEFAGLLAADWLVGDVTLEPVNQARDAFHQTIALSNVANWLNGLGMEEVVEEQAGLLAGSDLGAAVDLFKSAGRDADLLALILAYRHRHASWNKAKPGDGEPPAGYEGTGEILDKILATRPATPRGVLAVLDLISDLDLDQSLNWPAEAIEGLREIAAREARS
jgi:hypothetical protein